MVQERRGMLKVWNLSLIVGTFSLTVLGTFLTRGSILASVHAFAESIVGPLYFAFLTLVLLGGFGLIAWRRESLRAEATFDTPLSRESVFLGNNVLLLVLTFTVLVGTIYPLLAEAVTGGKVSVGSPFFNRNTAPVALLLLFLMGIGPLLPWRAASPSAVLRRLQVPMWAAAVTAALLALTGAGVVAVIVFGLAAFVAAATVAEMVRGVQAQRRAHGISVGAAIGSAVARNHRLYGGLVVHLGLIVAVVGVSWAALADRSSEVTIARGEIVHAKGYDLRFDGLTTREEPQRRVLVAKLTVLDPETGDEVVRLQPSLNLYPSASEPIGTPSIRTGTPFNGMVDLYASLVAVENDTRASFRFFVNPGIGLLWLGGAVMALGGVVAAWPTRPRAVSPRGPEPLAERREEVTV
jgi:cytochrome c-type biogenesis protein CcmF